MGADPVLNWLAKAVRELQVKLRKLERQGASSLEAGIGFQWNVHAPVFVPKAYLRLAQHLDPLEKPAKTEEFVKPEEHPKEKEVFEFKPTPCLTAKKKQVRFLLPLSPRFPGVMQSYQADLARRQLREPCSGPSLSTPATSCCSTSPPSRATADEEADPRIELHAAVETALQDWQEVFASVKEVIFHGFLESGWLEDQLFYIAHDVAEVAGGSLTDEAAHRAVDLAIEFTERVDLIRDLRTEAGRAAVARVLANLELQFNSFIWNAAASAAAG